MSSTAWVIIAFVIYASLMIFIGLFFFRKSNNISDYFLGGRKLNPWVAALSAQAAGIISGGLTVIIWDYLPIISGDTLGGATGLYSLIPGFFISLAAIIVVSLTTKAPSPEMSDEFEKASVPIND